MKLGWTRIAIRDLIHVRRHIAQDEETPARRSCFPHDVETPKSWKSHVNDFRSASSAVDSPLRDREHADEALESRADLRRRERVHHDLLGE